MIINDVVYTASGRRLERRYIQIVRKALRGGPFNCTNMMKIFFSSFTLTFLRYRPTTVLECTMFCCPTTHDGRMHNGTSHIGGRSSSR